MPCAGEQLALFVGAAQEDKDPPGSVLTGALAIAREGGDSSSHAPGAVPLTYLCAQPGCVSAVGTSSGSQHLPCLSYHPTVCVADKLLAPCHRVRLERQGVYYIFEIMRLLFGMSVALEGSGMLLALTLPVAAGCLGRRLSQMRLRTPTPTQKNRPRRSGWQERSLMLA